MKKFSLVIKAIKLIYHTEKIYKVLKSIGMKERRDQHSYTLLVSVNRFSFSQGVLPLCINSVHFPAILVLGI